MQARKEVWIQAKVVGEAAVTEEAGDDFVPTRITEDLLCVGLHFSIDALYTIYAPTYPAARLAEPWDQLESGLDLILRLHNRWLLIFTAHDACC